ncbi:LamG-like jellyroll fold domain-containing protein [Mammaliicoccus sciuri]|uniref:LamG-like jellyroll fold domain-containing protein n=1 Tax=Mammaliicoccus sciuri TaxID=1296 RepID=UPI0019514D91|nr:LamG-like jellyroll fold domain-containing protein [Mammaliicoccus sciuri]
MSQVKLGDKNIPFIYQGNELLYPNPVKDGLVLWYDLKGMKNSDVTKGITKDLSGNTTQNAKHFGFLYTSQSGYANKGIKFDGVDDRIIPIAKHDDGSVGQLDMKKINNGQKFSVEIAFKMSDKLITQGSEIFMTKRTYGRFWVTFIKDNNASSEQFVLTTSTYYGAEGERSIFLFSSKEGYKYGDEFHITVTLDKNDKLIIYVNGVKKGEQDLSGITITTPQENDFIVFIGQNSATEYYRRFDHELYSLKVYDRVLTDQEVQHNYNLEKERWGL